MTRYPQLEEPLPPGHITLKDYAPQAGRALGTIETHWRPKPGFPEPVGELPSRGRHGGGRGRLVYLTHQIDAFFAANQPAGGRDHRPMRPPSLGQEARVTAGWFATNVAGVARKTVTQYRDQPTFPRADDDGKYRLGDLMDWWPTRRGRGNWTPRGGQRAARARRSGRGRGRGRRAGTRGAVRRAPALR